MPQYCLVKHHIVSSVIDGPDFGNEPDTLPISGDVTFYPVLDRGDSVVVTDGAEKISHILSPVSARIVNGKISVDGEEGVKLFAGGPDSNPDRIRYRARFTGLNIAGSKSVDLKDILFEAIPGGELALSMAQPVPGAPYPGYSATIEVGISQIKSARDEALAQVEGAVAGEIGSTSSVINGSPENADRIVRLDGEGKLFLTTASITRDGDLINKAYLDAKVINNTSSYVGDGNSDAYKIVRLDDEGKLSVRTDRISRPGDVVSKDYVDTKVDGQGTYMINGASENARKLVRLDDSGKLFLTADSITRDGDLVNKYYVDQKVAQSGGGGGLAHQGRGKPSNATPYLNIPTPDSNPSVGHPDVLVIEGGWRGYEYWMGFTPFPREGRENPCIVASHDGVNWEVPPGLINPISPYTEALSEGHAYWSDTDLVHLPNGNLACYFRGTTAGGSDVVVRKVSSDGVNWGPIENVLTAPFTSVMSPAIIVEADGTFSMWSVNFLRPPIERLERRTSPDGVTWSAPESCTNPGFSLGYMWHIDVVRVGELYHAIAATRDSERLYYRWSRDGITWEGPENPIPLTRYNFDSSGHYRSTLVALPGGKFDIWLTGINAPNGDIFEAAQWRIGLLRDVDLIAL